MEKKIKAPVLSLNAKIEQLAKFLRLTATTLTSVKTKNITTTNSLKHTKVSSVNTINQIAKILRNETHQEKKKKTA